jgi:hypothetical protein
VGAKLAVSVEAERIMAMKQSGVQRVKSSAASRRLAAAAKRAVEHAAEAKKRVRDAKVQLKTLRKLSKLAKKAAKSALKKAQYAKPVLPTRAAARSAATRATESPTLRASAAKRRPTKIPPPRRQPAEVARSVIRRMRDESGHSRGAIPPAEPRETPSAEGPAAQSHSPGGSASLPIAL